MKQKPAMKTDRPSAKAAKPKANNLNKAPEGLPVVIRYDKWQTSIVSGRN